MIAKIFKFLVYLVILSIIGIVSGHFTFELLSYGRTVVVPDLGGKNIEEAKKLLSSKKLNLRLDGESHDVHIPQGNILRQDIPHGNKVKEGREVGIILSKGPRIRNVPDLTGTTLDAAEAVLKDKGLKINRIIYVHSNFAEKNIILAQRPEPHESGGDAFSVVVSLGKFSEEENK
jgi:serine/threonine-protein kinase